MGYDSKNYVEKEDNEGSANAGTFITGEVVKIDDGTMETLVRSKDALFKFKDPKQKAIRLTVESKEHGVSCENLVAYYEDSKGKMVVKKSSNLGKYKALYKKVPEVGDTVKLLANAKGYYKLWLG